MVNEEYLMKISLLEQEAKQAQEKLEAVKEQASDFEALKLSLERIDQNAGGEFLASLGKGIFVKSELKDKELFVNIGNGIIVKKNIKETLDIIDKQLATMQEIKKEVLGVIQQVNEKLQEVFMEINGKEA